ncbi:hypothetical protein AB5I41_18250 [Sphingomonas sp. MMS24-JH45]
MRGGVVILNGKPVARGPLHYRYLPIDDNATCDPSQGPALQVRDEVGAAVCRLPVVTETLPNGRRYDTVDLERDSPVISTARSRSGGARLPDGGQSRPLRRQPLPPRRVRARARRAGAGGSRRAGEEFVTFSLDGSTTLNPLTWWSSLRSGRAGTSLHPERVR